MDQADLGKKALAASNYEEAITYYTKALVQSPTSPLYLIQRSTAYQRHKNYPSALADANRAVLEARKRAKREQIIEAQFRRGVALYSLEKYGDAEFVLGVVKRMDEKFKGLEMWINKCKMTLAKEGLEESKKQCTIEEVPEVEESGKAGEVKFGIEAKTQTAANGVASTEAATTPSQPQQTSADKIRHDWYQNNQNVYFTLLAKGVPKDKAQIDITARSLSISFPLATGSSYDYTLEPLFDDIDPEQSTSRVLSTKIEITLVKKTQGLKWRALESDTPVDDKTTSTSTTDATAKAAALNGPVYPTSSKSGPKNWDKVTADATAALHNPDAKAGSLENDDDYEGGDEANHFFKKLFKDASPEVRRAMTKSYQESNGTALSTNWEEVSKGKVETSPPDGMEAKQWG
ncbi:Cochaperone protein [Recurvomyces mirabilis]|uniref:Cochaperone protein n=1 Tax=Recurvomyces mirabilis TaxID=574656 RepID=A0AAE0WX16_9PEZI|nr:Cochaperone protein [Recurvomyces mirabilis]KAK5161734.1 Cochaperone protein [Recurvomyces mirabilis]